VAWDPEKEKDSANCQEKEATVLEGKRSWDVGVVDQTSGSKIRG